MRSPSLIATIAALAAAVSVAPALAGEADVVDVQSRQDPDGTWRFDVTVRHADEGWDHYADRWEILAPDGAVIATRTLLHPHVDEQPFTRSLSGVEIPDGMDRVTIRARDSIHGLGGQTIEVTLGEAPLTTRDVDRNALKVAASRPCATTSSLFPRKAYGADLIGVNVLLLQGEEAVLETT